MRCIINYRSLYWCFNFAIIAAATSYGIGTNIGIGILTSLNNISEGVAVVTCSTAIVNWWQNVLPQFKLASAMSCLIPTLIGMASQAILKELNGGGESAITSRSLNYHPHVGGYDRAWTVSGSNITTYQLNEDSRLGNSTYQLDGYGDLVNLFTYGSYYWDNAEVNATNYVGAMFLGTHQEGYKTLFVGGVSHEDLHDKIVSSAVNTTSFEKRDGEYYVDWASYSFNDVQTGDAENFEGVLTYENPSATWDVDTNADTWLQDNMGQKICIAPFSVSPADGPTDVDVDEAERLFAAKGEVYWNAYGGIDSFCDDADDDMGE